MYSKSVYYRGGGHSMKKTSFDPSAPLPDFILNQFLKETTEKETKKEEKKIELPPNFVVLNDPKKLKEERKKKAQKELEEMMNREGIKRVNYGTVLADRTKARVPSADFANNSEKKKKNGK